MKIVPSPWLTAMGLVFVSSGRRLQRMCIVLHFPFFTIYHRGSRLTILFELTR